MGLIHMKTKYKSPRTRSCNLRIPVAIDERLTQIAQREGLTRTSVMVIATQHYLNILEASSYGTESEGQPNGVGT